MNIYRFISNKTSALLLTLICILTLAACAGGEPKTSTGISVLDLRIIPDTNNATLIWDNPDADIASINITYHNRSTPDALQYFPLITEEDSISSNATNVTKVITNLEEGSTYSFRVALKLEGDDENATTSAMQIIRLIGPNLDGDDLADAVDEDKDGDGVNDNLDAFPRNAALSNFTVAGLTARPGNGEVTLSWNNPFADIANISISYGITGSGASTTVAASNTGRGASVEQTIAGLTNGRSYTFTVSLTLTGANIDDEVMVASDTATPNVLSVTNLVATPGAGSVTLSWNNPAADIASISISYQQDGSTLQEFPTITDSSKRGMSTMGVQQVIPGLTNEEYYNFTVDLTLEGDDTGREGTAPFVTVAIGPNDDGDGIANFLDVDADGDGLIEIATAAQLDQIRYNLLGSSLNTSDGVAGDASGCGGQPGISECNGYELTQNISLDGYNSDNWIPIGSCTVSVGVRICNSESSFFDAIFDGNGWIISNLTITNPGGNYVNAAGLFAVVTPTAVLRNIHLRSANISGGGTNVGLLVGSAAGAKISNSSVEGEVTATGGQVGGLVGYGDSDIIITSSYAKFSSVRGDVNVGGLVGFGVDATITSSYATGGSVSGRGQVGGLVGRGDAAEIMSSYAEVGTIIGSSNYAGGMIGLGPGVTITSSYAKVGAVSGSHNLGGLVGGGQSATITSSYAEVGSINGSSTTSGRIGGLVGTTTIAEGDVTIISSYAATGTLSSASSENTLGGLLGFGTLNAASSNSYWNNETSGITGGSVAGKIEGKTTDDLQMPEIFAGSIYATWATDMCDDDSRAWDLGLNDQYPALNCTPGGADAQRP